MYAITINDLIKKKYTFKNECFRVQTTVVCRDVKMLSYILRSCDLVIHGCFFGYLFRKKDKHKKWWKLNLIIRNSWHLRKDVLHSEIHEISKIKKKNQKTMQWWNQNPVIFLKYWSCFIYFFIFNLIVCYDNVIWETF